MSKKLTYKGKLDMGVPEDIYLRTQNGKTGYRIVNFKVISSTPGIGNSETIVKVYSRPQTDYPATVDFTESDLLAVAYYQDNEGQQYPSSIDIIFDNEVFNQNIQIYAEDADSKTIPINYYLELETVQLTDIQATQLTLKSLRSIK